MGRDYFLCRAASNARCKHYGSGAYQKQQREQWRRDVERFFALVDAGKASPALHIPRAENACTRVCTQYGDCRYCINVGFACQFCIRNQLKMDIQKRE